MKFIKEQKTFLEWLRWYRWERLYDEERIVIGAFFNQDGLSGTPRYVQNCKIILNTLRHKFLTEYKNR